MSYLALRVLYSRRFFVEVLLAASAFAAIARQRMMFALISPAWVLPFAARLWEASHKRAYGKK